MMHAGRLAAMAGAVSPAERNRLAPGSCVNGRDATWVDRLIATHDAAISIREPGVLEVDDAVETARVLDALLRACALHRLVRGPVSVGLQGGPMSGNVVSADPDTGLARFLARNGYTNVTTFGVSIDGGPRRVDLLATHDGVERGLSRDEVATQITPTSKRARKRTRKK